MKKVVSIIVMLIALWLVPSLYGAQVGIGSAAPLTTGLATSTPTVVLSPTLTPTATLSPTLTPTATLSPTLTPTATLNPTLTPTATLNPTLTPTATVVEYHPTPTVGFIIPKYLPSTGRGGYRIGYLPFIFAELILLAAMAWAYRRTR